MEDIEPSVSAWLTTVCHYWPGITPWNVYTLRYCDWCRFVLEMEALEARSRRDREPSESALPGAINARR